MRTTIFGHDFEFLTRPDQWEKLKNFLYTNFWENKAIFCTLVLLAIIIVILLFTKKTSARNRVVINRLTLLLYICVLLIMFILNKTPGERRVETFLWSDYVIENGFHETMVMLAFLEIAAFLPFGYFLEKAFTQTAFWKKLLSAFLFCGAMEVAQYILDRGVYSNFQIVLHMMGIAGGILFRKMILWFFKDFIPHFFHGKDD